MLTCVGHMQHLAGENTVYGMTSSASNSPSASVEPFDYYRGKIFSGASRPNALANQLEVLQEGCPQRSLPASQFLLRSAIWNSPSTASTFFALF